MTISRRVAIATRRERDKTEGEARREKARNKVPALWLRDGNKAIILLWKDFTLEKQVGIAEPVMLLQHYYRRKKWYSACSKTWDDNASDFLDDPNGVPCKLCAAKEEGDDQITTSRRYVFSFFDNTLIHRDNREVTRAGNQNKALFTRCAKNYGKPCSLCDAATTDGPVTGAEDEWKDKRMFPAKSQGNSYWVASGDAYAAMETAAEKVAQTCSVCQHGELTIVKFMCSACGSDDVKELGFEGVRCNSCDHKGSPDAEHTCSNGCTVPEPWKITRVPLEILRKGSGAQDTNYMVTPLFARGMSDEKYNAWRKKSGIQPLHLLDIDDLTPPTDATVQSMIGHSLQEQNWRQNTVIGPAPTDAEHDPDKFVEDDIPF